jgi:hypothetical protein
VEAPPISDDGSYEVPPAQLVEAEHQSRANGTALHAMTFPLPNDNLFEVRLRKPVTEEEFERMEVMFQMLKPAFVRQGDELE